MIKRICVTCGCALLLSGLPVLAQTPDATPPPLGAAAFKPTPDIDKRPLSAQSFVTRAAATSLAEIELGELALTKAASPEVKAFAQRMIKDHKASLEQLKSVAAGQKIALPATTDEKHRLLKQQLAALDGKAFDVQYLKAMANGHDEAVALFEAAAAIPEIPDPLKQYAAQTLSTVKQHRDAAHSLHGK